MSKYTSNPIIIFVFSFMLIMSIFYYMTHSSTSDIINDAASRYAAGEAATTVFERQNEFNKALGLYLDLETRFDPRSSNGKLYYNIGNTFYQLGEYPLAILYYTRALALNSDARIKENLRTAREKANVLAPKTQESLLDTFFLKNWFSLPSRIQLFSLFAALALGLFSASLFYGVFRFPSYIFMALTAFFLLGILAGLFISPQEAVVITSENLRKGASLEFANVSEQPLPAGSLVEVVGEETQGSWLKVIYNETQVGFIPAKSVRKV